MSELSEKELWRLTRTAYSWDVLMQTFTEKRVAARGGVRTEYDDGFEDGMRYCIDYLYRWHINAREPRESVMRLVVDNTVSQPSPIAETPARKTRTKSKAKPTAQKKPRAKKTAKKGKST